MPTLFRLGFAFVLAIICGICAAQQVTVSKTSAVYSEPNPGSSKVGEIKEGAPAEVLGRQGAFVNVKSGAATGWIFAFNVNFGSSGGAAASSSASRKPAAASATIGIRGLDKEDMKNAQYDGKQLDALDSFADDKGGGSRKK